MNQDDIINSTIRAILQKGFRDIEKNPKKGVTNLIETGCNFANSKLQKEFFYNLREICSHPDCSYYSLAKNLVKYVDPEILETFGMNVGYNSLNLGVKKIRQFEYLFDCHIPWTILFDMTHKHDTDDKDKNVTTTLPAISVDQIISQGQSIGIVTYILFIDNNQEVLNSLNLTLQKYPNCAFLLFISPTICNKEIAVSISKRKNVMISLHFNKLEDTTASDLLTEEGNLFGTHYEYADESAEKILTGEIFETALDYSSPFIFLVSDPSCSEKTQASVSTYIHKVRNEGKYPIVIIDLMSDILEIDDRISHNSNLLIIRDNGDIYSNRETKSDFNIKHDTLIHSLMELKQEL